MTDIARTADNLPLVLDSADQPEVSTTANWLAVSSLSLGAFAMVTSEFLPISLLTPMADDLNVSVGAAGQAVTTTAVVAGVAALFTAIVTRKIDRRHVLAGLTVLLIASGLIAATASSYLPLLVARVLLGVGLGGFWSMAGATALRLVPARSVPRALSIVFAGVSAATVLAAPIGAYIGDVWGWRAAFHAATALAVIALALQLVALPKLPPRQAPSLGSLVALTSRPRFAIGLVAILLMISGHFSGFTYIRPFLEQGPRFGVEAVSLTLLAFGVAGFIGTAAAGPIMARSIKADIVLGGLLVAGVSGVLLAFGAVPAIAVAGIAIWGFSFGLIPVGFQTWGVKAEPNDTEAVGAVMVAAFQTAITLGAAIGGLLVNGFGPLAAIVYAGLACLSSALIVLGSRSMAVK